MVAALVRGMLVKDALMQLQVTVKRAAKTVYQVVTLSIFHCFLIEQGCKSKIFNCFLSSSGVCIIFYQIFLSPPSLPPLLAHFLFVFDFQPGFQRGFIVMSIS